MMTMLQGPERLVHWALAPEYDLYRHRHLPKPEVRRAWIHEAAPGLDDLEETAVAAGGERPRTARWRSRVRSSTWRLSAGQP
jgi:hypothetical protein